jgi:hypothetical protein
MGSSIIYINMPLNMWRISMVLTWAIFLSGFNMVKLL